MKCRNISSQRESSVRFLFCPRIGFFVRNSKTRPTKILTNFGGVVSGVGGHSSKVAGILQSAGADDSAGDCGILWGGFIVWFVPTTNTISLEVIIRSQR